jgi:hypothetical protein
MPGAFTRRLPIVCHDHHLPGSTPQSDSRHPGDLGSGLEPPDLLHRQHPLETLHDPAWRGWAGAARGDELATSAMRPSAASGRSSTGTTSRCGESSYDRITEVT